MSEEEVDQRLRDLGVPEESISEMDLDYKRDVAENAIEYLGTESVSMFEGISTIEGLEDTNLIRPFGSIKASMLNFYIDVYRSSTKNNRERMMVYARFKWNSEPFWTLQDVVAIQWNSSKWRPVDNSFQSYISYGGTTERKSSTVMSDITASGVYDHVDIKSLRGTQSGYLKATIESKSTGSVKGSDQIFAKYIHNKISGSVGASFGKFGSISVSGSNYDERGASKTFSY